MFNLRVVISSVPFHPDFLARRLGPWAWHGVSQCEMRDCDPFSHCHPVSEGSYVIDQNQNQRQRLSREKRGQGGVATRTSGQRGSFKSM